MAVIAYTRGIEAITSGAVNIGAVTVKAMLTTVTYVENKATHQFRSQVTNEITSGTGGYTTGGINVSATVSRDEANNRVDLNLGSAVWTAPSGQTLANARKAVYYVDRCAGSDRLLAVSDFGADTSATNQTLTVAASVVRLQN